MTGFQGLGIAITSVTYKGVYVVDTYTHKMYVHLRIYTQHIHTCSEQALVNHSWDDSGGLF